MPIGKSEDRSPLQWSDIVILGAGVAGLRVALSLDKRLSWPTKITLIDRNNYHQCLYHLQKICNANYEEKEVVVPLSIILEGTRVSFIESTVTAIDPEERTVYTENGSIGFDVLVIALGSDVNYFGVEGAKENCLTLDSYSNAMKIRGKIVDAFEEAEETGLLPRIVIGGAGMTGIELAGELADWYPLLCRAFGLDWSKKDITLVELTGGILPGWDEGLAKKGEDTLRRLGIKLSFNDGIVEVTEDHIRLASGRLIQYDLFVWTCGVKGNAIATSGFDVKHGRIMIDEYCRAMGYDYIYIAGDCAYVVDPDGKSASPTAHIAMEHAEIISHNVVASIKGGNMKKYKFSRIGEVVTVGRTFAMADLYGFKFTGPLAKFMKRVVHLWYLNSIGGYSLVLKPHMH